MAFGNLTINGKTYSPITVTDGITRWEERSGGVASSFSPLTLSVKPPSGNSKNYRVQAVLRVPVVETVDSECGCDGDFLREIRYEVVALIPATSLPAERVDANVRIRDSLATANFIAAFQDLIPTYS